VLDGLADLSPWKSRVGESGNNVMWLLIGAVSSRVSLKRILSETIGGLGCLLWLIVDTKLHSVCDLFCPLVLLIIKAVRARFVLDNLGELDCTVL
jgi:hypothetical protein